MAIGAGSLVSLTVGGLMDDQEVMNVYTYRVVGELGSPDPVHIAEAFWNEVKVVARPLVSVRWTQAFQFVRIRELDSLTGEYGEYSIPSGERPGSLGSGSDELLPTFVAAGFKLSVGSRVTRPGSKRFSGATEGALGDGFWTVSYRAQLDLMGAFLADSLNLIAPALGTELEPVVVRMNRVTGLPTANQPVVGYVLNVRPTSQVSRKVGHGS